VLYSELKTIEAGEIYTLSLKKGDEALTAEVLFSANNAIYYVVRERAAATEGESKGKIISTTYYQIKLIAEETGDSIGGTTAGVVDYKSATVEEETVTTYYMENGKVYVDVSATRGVTFIAMDNASYVVTECAYDETTKTYTGKLAGGGTFIVEMLEGGFVDVTINLSVDEK
jgi:hypothetical protein